ncbi:MAG: polysaccharide biosynthesis protein [Planctomycetes bacterium]|nr:polysaccharide biosynthesis protein [Planctomycetota bacterium]
MKIALPSQRPGLRRFSRRAAVLMIVHAAVFTVAYFMAFYTRNDFTVQQDWLANFVATVAGVVLLKLTIFYALGLCHVSWGRVAFGDLTNLLWAATLSMLVVASIDGLFLSTGQLPWIPRVRRSVILLDWAATILLLGGLRTVWRSIREELRPMFSSVPARTALIIGAGRAGEMIARGLQAASAKPYYVMGFLDDDPALRQTRVAGLEVLGCLDDVGFLVRKRNVQEVIVPSGYLSGRQFRALLTECTEAGAELKVLPGIDELLSGDKVLSRVQLRAVEIKDLLRREPVQLDDSAIRKLVTGRVIMVTGAGGSIGAEICRQVIRYAPLKLLLVERSENALFLLQQEFARLQPQPAFEPLLADVTDEARLEQIMQLHRPEVIFHAAAHKHVPMMEWNPAEAIKNNVFGTRLIARLADQYHVCEFVVISTDKAVNPTSVMGLSKLLAERFVQGLSRHSDTKFIVVRFGNVLASNGSVVPIFQDQIRRGGPLTVTHPGIERFFMTIPEASQLVLQAAAMGSGGEVFVLDMGERIKIVDLARDMVALSGLAADDIEIVFTGLRPGEKLYEELYFDEEERVATAHQKVFCARHRPADLAAVEAVLDDLRDVLQESPERIRARLRRLVPEYSVGQADEEAEASNMRRLYAK